MRIAGLFKIYRQIFAGVLRWSVFLLVLTIISLGNSQQDRNIKRKNGYSPPGTYSVRASPDQNKILQDLGSGPEYFALDFFTVVARSPADNYMISPFSIWSLLVLMSEGSAGNTYAEIKNTLRFPNQETLRSAYKIIDGILT